MSRCGIPRFRIGTRHQEKVAAWERSQQALFDEADKAARLRYEGSPYFLRTRQWR